MTGQPAIAAEKLGWFRAAARRKIAAELERERAEAEQLRQRVIPLLRQAVADARRQGLCTEVWLVGSFAWGRPTALSDVDLLANTADTTELAVLVGRRLRCDVHVVDPAAAPPLLCRRAAEEGIPL